jgi:hypothetical protein
MNPPFTWGTLMRLERIPTATILIRALRAPTDGKKALSTNEIDASDWESSGLVVTAPEYDSGEYCTQYCMTHDVEMALYDQRMKRKDPPMRETLKWV